MSGNLSSLAIGGGAIKQIQRGLSAAGTATLSPSVNTSKTVLHYLGNGNGAASVVLTNSTTVTIAAGGGNTSWQVVEYY